MADHSFHHKGFIMGSLSGPQFDPWVRKIPWRKAWQSTSVFLDFPGGSAGKESICNVRDLGSIPGLGRSPGGGYGNPLQYSCLENPHGQRSLAGYSPWGHKESDTIEWHSTKEDYCTTFCLSSHLLIDNSVVSTFWLLWMLLQWSLSWKYPLESLT